MVGAQKSATTSIFLMLEKKGLVCGRGGKSGVGAKEAHFFDDPYHNVFKTSSPGELRQHHALNEYLGGYHKDHCKAKHRGVVQPPISEAPLSRQRSA